MLRAKLTEASACISTAIDALGVVQAAGSTDIRVSSAGGFLGAVCDGIASAVECADQPRRTGQLPAFTQMIRLLGGIAGWAKHAAHLPDVAAKLNEARTLLIEARALRRAR